MIDRYDTASTQFYLGPPYYGTETYYQAAFGRAEFVEMADCLCNLQGRFILSLNGCPEVRDIFSNFDVKKVDAPYSLSRQVVACGRRGELLISN